MLKCGIIGAGNIADLHVLGYINSPNAEVIAISDLNIKRSSKKLELWNLRTTNNFRYYYKLESR